MSTKNNFLTLFLLLWATSLAYSQSRFAIGPIFNFTRGNIATVEFPPGELGFTDRGNGVALGLTGLYELDSTWSITAGLAYNWLKYYRRLPERGVIRKTEDVQLPVMVNYRSSSKRLSPYFSMGAMLEKRMVTRVAVSPAYVNSDIRTKLPISVWLGMGAGISYRISSKCSFIAQPTLFYMLKTKEENLLYAKFDSFKVNVQAQFVFYF